MRQLDRGFHVDATEHAVTANVGVDDGLNAVILELFGQINHFVAGQLAPAVGGYFAIFGIQANNNVTAKGRTGILQKTGVFNGCGANDDVTQTGIEVALNRVEVANTTTELHVYFAAHRQQYFPDGGFVFRLASKSTVQIHQVQAACAFVYPAARHGRRVVTEDGRLIHVALLEANAVTVFQINRGDE